MIVHPDNIDAGKHFSRITGLKCALERATLASLLGMMSRNVIG